MMSIDQPMIQPDAAAQRTEKLDPARKAKLQKAVREFESVFVSYMLKSMRNTVEKADNSTDSFGGDMLESMFDMELAKHISKNSNLGLAEMLYRKMTGEQLASPKSPQTVDRPGSAAGSPISSKTLEERLTSFRSYIDEASAKFGVRDSLIRAVIAAESSARPEALSAKDAKGLMQLIDATAADMGVKDVWNPRENILGGTKYLKHLLEKFDGDQTLAVASYNAGPGAVQRHGGVPPYKETKEYVARVLGFLKQFEQEKHDDE
jgi:Rod binding domain-containing protein